MRKKALWVNSRTGETSDNLPDGAKVVNVQHKKNDGNGIDLKSLLMSGGSGLLAYTMADQMFGDDGSEKKKRNAFDRLLSKLIPIGIGGLGAYAGHQLANSMYGNDAQGVKKAAENAGNEEQYQEYYVDGKEFGLPSLKVAKPPVKLENDRPSGYDKDGNPYLEDDFRWSPENLHDYYRDAMNMSRKTGKPIGECLDAMERSADDNKALSFYAFLPLSGGSWLAFDRARHIRGMADRLRTAEAAQRAAENELARMPMPRGRNGADQYNAMATPIANRGANAAQEAGELRKALRYGARRPGFWRAIGLGGGALTAADLLWGLWNARKSGRTSTARGYLTEEGKETIVPPVE